MPQCNEKRIFDNTNISRKSRPDVRAPLPEPLRYLREPSNAAAVFSAVLMAAAILIVASTLYVVAHTHHPLPLQEEWMNIIVFKSWLTGAKPLEDLLSQHSEHRILFPRLVMFADYLWFGGGGYFSLAAIIFGLCALTAVFLCLLYRLGPKDAGAIGVAATVVAMIFSLAQWENFRSAIQIYFVEALTAASCAILLFAAGLQRVRDGRPSAVFILASFLLVAVATFSMASGLLSGFVLTLTAVLAHAPRRYAVMAGAATAAIAGAYFYHYRLPDAAELYSAFGPPPKDASQPAWLEGPIGFVVFALAYLGNFLDPWIAAAVALGAVGAVAVMADFWRRLLGRDATAERLAPLGIALFTAGSAFLTAIGRLPHEGLGAAMSSRYTLASACFWSAVLVSAWSRTAQREFRRARHAAIALCCIVLTGAALMAQEPGAAVLEDQAFLQNGVENALLQGLFDRRLIEAAYTNPDWVRALAPLLKERGMSIFATGDARLFRASLSEAGMIDDAPCRGAFSAAILDESLGPGGVRVGGVADIASAPLSGLRLYLVDASKKIVGFASRLADDGSWTGYATAQAQAELSAYARQTSGRLCLLGTRTVSTADATDPP